MLKYPSRKYYQTQKSPGSKRYVAFVDSIPSAGHDVIYIVPGKGEKEFPPMEASDTHITNGKYQFEVDPETGFISRLFDTENLVDVFKGQAYKFH